jgi:hypothetical protein
MVAFSPVRWKFLLRNDRSYVPATAAVPATTSPQGARPGTELAAAGHAVIAQATQEIPAGDSLCSACPANADVGKCQIPAVPRRFSMSALTTERPAWQGPLSLCWPVTADDR